MWKILASKTCPIGGKWTNHTLSAFFCFFCNLSLVFYCHNVGKKRNSKNREITKKSVFFFCFQNYSLTLERYINLILTKILTL